MLHVATDPAVVLALLKVVSSFLKIRLHNALPAKPHCCAASGWLQIGGAAPSTVHIQHVKHSHHLLLVAHLIASALIEQHCLRRLFTLQSRV
jgi:hypothetical protein